MHDAVRHPIRPDQRAAGVAARQFGLLSHRQAAAAGLSPDQIHNRVRSGRWLRVARGVYQLAGTPPSWRRDVLLSVLAAPAGARACGLTALALHGVGARSPLTHVLVERGRSVRTPDVLVHLGRLSTVDHATVDGIPCTTVPRALVDAAALVDRRHLDELVDEAFCAAKASAPAVLAALDRAGSRGRTGAGMLRDSVEVWTQPIAPGSVGEMRFLRRLLECGVDDVVTQYEVRDEHGAFVGRVDAASPSRRIAWEYDSDRFHGPREWAHGESRHAALVRLGWRVERIAKVDLLPSSTRLRDSLGLSR